MNRQERRHGEQKKSSWKIWLIIILIIAAIAAFMIYKNTRGTGIDYSQYNYTDDVYAAPNANVTIEEFSDFECPYCGALDPTIRAVRDANTENVRIIYKEFPLRTVHPLAEESAEAAECAREQNKFWAYHDVLFDSKMLESRQLKLHAQGLGLNMTQWNECMNTGRAKTTISASILEGQQRGVQGTPTVFLNGQLFSGRTADDFSAAIASS